VAAADASVVDSVLVVLLHAVRMMPAATVTAIAMVRFM
jgi:hypothetical protein